PCKCKELFGKISGSDNCILCILQTLIDRLRIVQLKTCKGDIAKDRSQEIVEIVSNSSRNYPKRLKLHSFQHLLSGLPEFGYILQSPDMGQDIAVWTIYRTGQCPNPNGF